MLVEIKKILPWALMSAALTFFACSPVPSFYLVADDDFDPANLTGQWEGKFTTSVPGRYGTIFMTITTEEDTAYGSVVLTWDTGYLPYLSVESSPATDRWMDSRQVLSIKEILFDNGRIGGVVAPYRDYECGCLVTTKFQGRLNKDAMQGSFESLIKQTGVTYNGKWKVKRWKKDS